MGFCYGFFIPFINFTVQFNFHHPSLQHVYFILHLSPPARAADSVIRPEHPHAFLTYPPVPAISIATISRCIIFPPSPRAGRGRRVTDQPARCNRVSPSTSNEQISRASQRRRFRSVCFRRCTRRCRAPTPNHIGRSYVGEVHPISSSSPRQGKHARDAPTARPQGRYFLHR